MNFCTLDHIASYPGRVLLRVDLNVPIMDGKVTDQTRIERIVPTVLELIKKKAKIILLSHFGRPNGKKVSKYSLSQIVMEIENVLEIPVSFIPDCIGERATAAISELQDGGVLLLENVRFYIGEETGSEDFARALALNGDLYINDAFSASHRSHASICALAHLLPCYAGRLMQTELETLENGLRRAQHPVVAIIGGAKVSTKIAILQNMIAHIHVDSLVIGGGMANTFLAAQGISIGQSLCEYDFLDLAKDILFRAQKKGCQIILPVDALVAEHLGKHPPAPYHDRDIHAVSNEEMILDIGPRSIQKISHIVEKAKALIWNGPLGAFEISPFDRGTVEIAKKVAQCGKNKSLSVSIAGGGDTIAALKHAGAAGNFTYLSTAGGAFLEWLEGKILPGVAALMKKSSL